jgi:hypothetical protein
MTTYKEELHEAITQLQQATKRGEMPREVRLGRIEALAEEYFAKAGEMPDGVALERMADLILYEELSNTHPDKVTRTEYPFFSEHQFEERYKAEASFKWAEEHGVDGRDHKPPVRRIRTKKDNKFLDKNAKIRNKERKHRYTEFTKVQPIIIQTLKSL